MKIPEMTTIDFDIDLGKAKEIFDVSISQEVVAEMTDIATLKRYYSLLKENASQISDFVEAYKQAEIPDEDWFLRAAGKKAYFSIAAKWVEQRILALGEVPPYPRADPRGKQISLLLEKVKKLSALVKSLGGEVPA